MGKKIRKDLFQIAAKKNSSSPFLLSSIIITNKCFAICLQKNKKKMKVKKNNVKS